MSEWKARDAARFLDPPTADSHKYRRGVLGARIGSSAYPGAAVLGVEAAWRTGIGVVRYSPPLGDDVPDLGLPSPAAAVLSARPETIVVDGHQAVAADCDAWLLGSGTDPRQRSFAERSAIAHLLSGDTPLVVDAGALSELGEQAAPVVITPHIGEFRTFWERLDLGGTPIESASPTMERVHAAAQLAARLGVTVLLKGSVTAVATPGGFGATAGPATPWLATAGTGDVLAGILGALVATHGTAVGSDPELLGPLAASAAVIHDMAARIAAGDPRGDDPRGDVQGRPITALDVAHALPDAVAAARHHPRGGQTQG